MLRSHMRRGREVALVALALVAASFGSAGADPGPTGEDARGSGWHPIQRLTGNPGESEDPSVAVDGLVVHTAWSDEVGGDDAVLYRRSVDSGGHWLPRTVVRTTSTGPIRAPVVDVECNWVHVVWEEVTWAPSHWQVWYRRSLNKGVTWKPARRVSPASHNALRADVAVESDDVHVVWESHHGTTVNVWYRRSGNGGVNWDPPVRLSRDNGHSQYPTVAVDQGIVHVAWEDTRATGWNIFYRRSMDGGTTWQGAEQISTTSEDSAHATLEVTGKVVHVAWVEDHWGGDIAYRRSLNYGHTWQLLRRIGRCNWGCGAPAIATSDATVVDLVYADLVSQGNHQIAYRRSYDAGGSWHPELLLTSTSGNAEHADIDGNSNGVNIVWDDDTPGDAEIYHKHRG